MNDLISRKDVLALCGNKEWLEEYHTEENGVKTRGYDTLKMINYSKLLKLPSAEKIAEWIPVKERKPKFNDIVLASTNSDYDELRVVLTVYKADEFWFNGAIKAWMPLPEPYKEEEEWMIRVKNVDF